MSSVQLTPAAARWLSTHQAVATSAELRACGLGRKAIDRLCAMGVLVRITRGLFALATATTTLAHRCRVLCGLYPSGFITGPTLGMIEGIRRMPMTAALHFSVLHGLRLDHLDGVLFRQTTKLCPDDRRERDDGIIVASWPRFAFDVGADLTPLDHRSVIHQLLDTRRVTPEALVHIGERLCHPARRGTMTWRLSMAELGLGVHDSHPEVRLGDALLRLGVPIEPQVEVPRIGRVSVHLDLGVPAVRWGVELDIHPEHRSVDGHQRDSRRVRSLHVVDWQIEPVSELDMRDVESLAAELSELYHDRVRAIGGSNAPTGAVQPSGALQPSGAFQHSGLIDSTS
jgi:hypothetical protein